MGSAVHTVKEAVMPMIGPTEKSAGAGSTDPNLNRAIVRVRDGKKVFEGRDEVVERIVKIHCLTDCVKCLTDCVKTVAPYALKVVFLLLIVTVWKAGLPDVNGLVQLLGAVRFW
jgi:hypothetical protein